MPIGTPAGILNVLVIANTGQANAALTKTRAAFRLTGVEAQKTAAASSAAWGRAGAAAALAAGVVAAASSKMAIDFDKSMRNVNSIAQLPERQFKKLEKSVLSLAGPTAQAPVTIANGLYDLVSSGFDAAESLVIVKEAALGATAGLTDTAVSTKAVAAVLNAYRRPAKDAKDVTDTLFRTVDKGVITFEDLAQNIGDTLPFASSLGVTLSQVGGATATLTKQGLSASETMTRIRNVIQTMIKPGTELKATFKSLNTTGEDLVRKKGLQGALQTLEGTTDGTKEAMAALFPNIRALGGALALTGENTQAATKDLQALKHHTDATAHALEQQSKSVSFQWNQVKAEVSAVAIEFGTKLLPVIIDGVHALGDLGGAIFDVAEALGGMDGNLQAVILAMAGAAVATKALLMLAPLVVGMGGNVAFLGSMYLTAARQGTILATTATLLRTAFLAHPILTIAAGVGLAATAVIGLGHAFGFLGEEEKKTLSIGQQAAQSFKAQQSSFKQLKNAIQDTANAKKRDTRRSNEVRKAEESLIETRKEYGPTSHQAKRAEIGLAQAKRKSAQASDRLEAAERLEGIQKKIQKVLQANAAQDIKKNIVNLKGQRKAILQNLDATDLKTMSDKQLAHVAKNLDRINRELGKGQLDLNKVLDEASRTIGPNYAEKISKMSQSTKGLKDRMAAMRDVGKQSNNVIKDGGEIYAGVKPQTDKLSGAVKMLGKNYGELHPAVVEALAALQNSTNRALKALNVAPVNFGISSGKKQKKQAGGRLVGGSGSGDKIHLMAEPGEVVWNREAVAGMGGARAANRPNIDYPRFQGGGEVGGGLNFALGPYDIPPIAYDAAHAGGNAHVHITGTTTPWVVAVGKQLQKMGFLVGEHPAFGGVQAQHSATGGHYDALAIDVNSSASLSETRAEVSSIARLLGGSISGGAISGTIEKLARVMITGPDGVLKSMGQSISDNVHKGASKLIASKRGTEGFESSGTLIPGAPIKSLPKNLAKWNKQYPYDSTETMPMSAISAVASWQRLPGWFPRITVGESAGQPGAVGHDPGGTTGYGLYQETDPFANPYVKAVTGTLDYNKMLNPVLNTMAAKLHFNAAPSQVPNTPGFPWFGTSGLQLGGILMKMRKGGILPDGSQSYDPLGGGFVQNFVKTFKGTEGSGDRRKLVSETLDTIRQRAAFGVNSLNKDGSLSGRLVELREMADKFQEYADNSFSLNSEAPWDLSKDMSAALPYMVKDGEDIVQAFGSESEAQGLLKQLQEGALGRFHGRTEGGWLGGIEDDPGKLQTLLKLRNRLIEATDRIKKVKTVIQNMIETVEKQVATVRDAIKAGDRMRQQLEEERKGLQKKLENATDNQAKGRERIKAELDKEMGRPKNKRDEQRINQLRHMLQEKSPERQVLQEQLKNNHEKMKNLLGKQSDRGSLMTALKDKLKPAFKDRLETLVAGSATVAEELITTQGSVSNFAPIKGIPDLGVLGGDIFTTQLRLKELNFQPGEFSDDAGSETAGGIGIAELLKFAEAVRLGAFGSVSNIPVFGAGGMSPGGYALVGDRGPELLNLPGGTQILNNRQTQAAMPGTFILEVSLGGETVNEMIDVKLKDEDGRELGRWRQGRAPGG